MDLKKVALASVPVLIMSCGGEGEFGSDSLGEFNTVVLYITGITPQPLESDIVWKIPQTVDVNAVDPTVEIVGDGVGDDDGICEPGEVCCSDIGPGNPVFQTQCCVGTAKVELCVGKRFLSDSVVVEAILEPKKDFAGEPISANVSPVLIQSVDMSFETLTPGCPDIPSTSESINVTIQPLNPDELINPEQNPTSFTVFVVSQALKEYIYSLATTEVLSYTHTDGCVTNFLMKSPGFCEYKANLRFNTLELFSGDREVIPASLSIKMGDFLSENENERECEL